MNQIAGSILRAQPFMAEAETERLKESDYDLARAAAKGVIAALGELYERHGSRVYSLCLRMTRNQSEAEDLTQEVFVQLFRKVSTFRGESQFTTWLYRLTVNHVLMHFRYLSTRREEIPDNLELDAQVVQQLKNRARTQIVDRIALDAAFKQLPAGCREVFFLFEIEGYEHDEIARMLGCTVGNSKSQLYKAKIKLRRLLITGRLRRRGQRR